AEDGIRDRNVTGVQTCALPISSATYIDGISKDPIVSDSSIISILSKSNEASFMMTLYLSEIKQYAHIYFSLFIPSCIKKSYADAWSSLLSIVRPNVPLVVLYTGC